MRLHKIAPEYQGRVRLRTRAFPLEVYGGGPPNRAVLESEMWLAALQEPEAAFSAFGSEWPTTTLPAFEGAWCAFQQGEMIGHEFDLRVRRAFFAEGRNIGRPEVINEIASESGLDMDKYQFLINRGDARSAVIEEGRSGKEVYKVRSTPTVMLADGRKLRHLIAFPHMENHKIISIGKLPCCGESCYEATRELFDKALESNPV